jgi:hypothetical protein
MCYDPIKSHREIGEVPQLYARIKSSTRRNFPPKENTTGIERKSCINWKRIQYTGAFHFSHCCDHDVDMQMGWVNWLVLSVNHEYFESSCMFEMDCCANLKM